MPDTIISVGFRSDGAPANARTGAYPILPSAIVMGANQRVKYSVRYVPATLTVQAAGPIAFTQKGQFGPPTPNGGVEWALPFTPVVGRTLVVLVGSSGSGQSAPGFSVPLTGGDTAYQRVGGIGYKAQALDVSPSILDDTLAVFWHKVEGGDGSETVKVTFTDPGGGTPNAQLVALEYENVSAAGPTAFCKAEVNLAAATRPNPLPALNLDNSTGQCVIAARYSNTFYPNAGSVGPDVQAGFTGRYSMKGIADVCDNNDINVMDRAGLSGFGPLTPTFNWTPGATRSNYAAIAFALTKG